MAALVLFFGISCAPNSAATSNAPADADLRVDVQWRLDLASDRGWEIDPREFGRPILSGGGDLFVGAANGWAYRVVPHTGEVQWATEVGGSIDAAGRLVGPTAYIGTDEAAVVALNWRNGQEQWRFDAANSVEGRPTVAGGRLFVTDTEDTLYALDATTGEELWTFQRQAPEFFTIKGGGQPLVVDDIVYCGFSDGNLSAFYADTGDEIWTVHLGDETGEFGDVDLPLIEYGDRIIAASHAGGVYSVDRDTGALMWRVDVSDITGIDMESGWLFATTATGAVMAMDARDGEMAWNVDLPEGQSGVGLSLVGPFVAVVSARGPMHWLSLTDGTAVAQWAPSSGFQNPPIFDDRQGYVMSNRGYLYGFGLAF